jgi:hypothetical protein
MSERRSVPVWAQTLDAVSLLLAFVAAIVAVSGGFRAHLGSVRLAVTSPLPLLAWCAAIAVARHLAAPQQPLYREFPDRIAAWSRLPGIRAAASAVIGTRPVMLFVGYLAVFMFGFANGRAPLRHFNNELLNLPVRWDAGWYLQIVTDGYRYTPGDPTVQQNIVFFPAYPMLMRVVGRLLGGEMTGYVAAGMFISIASSQIVPRARVPLRLCAGALRRRCGARNDLAAGRVPVRDLLRRPLHGIAVPAGDDRGLPPFHEAAVRPRRLLGAAGRADARQRRAADAAAGLARDLVLAGRDVEHGEYSQEIRRSGVRVFQQRFS